MRSTFRASTLLLLFNLLSLSALTCVAETLNNWRVQVIAVHDESLANRTEIRLEKDGFQPVGIQWRDGVYQVWTGSCATRAEALALQQRLADQGFADTFPLQLGPAGKVADASSGADGSYSVQIFSLSDSTNAVHEAALAEGKSGYDTRVVPGDGLYRVQLGPFESRDAAEFARQVIVDHGYTDAFLVRATP